MWLTLHGTSLSISGDKMVQGYERRDVVQDPALAASLQPKQADSVPLSPVMAPRPSSMAKVGERERELASVLGQASLGFEKYMQKKQAQWELQGKMAYAEGKTEEEIVAQGNRYTTAGFMGMKAKTAANVWQQNALSEIENGDKTMSSSDYQKKLSGQFKELTDKVAGADDYTRNLLSAIAEDMFPKLVAQHVQSNNSYNQQQTVDSYGGMLVSEAERFDPKDPQKAHQELEELMSPEISGLSPDVHHKTVANAIELNLNEGNGVLFETLGMSDKEKAAVFEKSAGLPEGLVSAVIYHESRGNRYAVSPKGAKSEMQVMDKTNLDPGYGVTPAADDSLVERARVGRDYLAAMNKEFGGNTEVALMAYNWGPGNVKDWIAAGANQKDVPAVTKKYVQNIKESMGTLDGVNGKTRNASIAALVDKGYSLADIQKIENAYDTYATRKSQEFNKDRLLTEDTILKDAAKSGNYPESVDMISQVKEVRGYSDDWANSMAAKAKTEIAKYEKARQETAEIGAALSSDRVAMLTPEKQQKALDMERERVSGVLDGQGSMPIDQKREQLQNHMLDVSIKNNVVDKTLQKEIAMGLSGSVIDEKTGSVKSGALNSYKAFLKLKQSGNYSLANNYVGENKALVYQAAALDSGNIGSPDALRAAQEILARKESGDKAPPINTKSIGKYTDKYVDGLDVSIFGDFMPATLFNKRLSSNAAFGATNFTDPTETELDSIRTSSVLKDRIEKAAILNKSQYPNMTDDAAVSAAADSTLRLAEPILGNIVFGSDQKSVREAMGFPQNTDKNFVHVAMAQYLDRYAPKYWEKYNKFEALDEGAGKTILKGTAAGAGAGLLAGTVVPVFGQAVGTVGGAAIGATAGAVKAISPSKIGQSIENKMRGVPDGVLVTYNPNNETFIVDVYTDQSKQKLTGKPMLIPAKELGRVALELDRNKE